MNIPSAPTALLQRCEAEQLHLSGAIQSFGALIRIDTTTTLVTHASANLSRFVGVDAPLVLGQPVDSLAWLPANFIADVPAQPGKTLSIQGIGGIAAGHREPVEGRAIRGNGCIIVEMEHGDADADRVLVRQLEAFLPSVPFDDNELAALHQTFVRAIRDINGFDRVMVYRFHADWSGEVIAEASRDSFGSYMGLHFPASDIPAIARSLYMINPCRMIPDAKAPPVAIVGLEATPPDLTWSDLRSVSPVHIEYLENMGAGASFSVPIIVHGQLWGLVACHSREPNLLSPNRRTACVTLTSAYALVLLSYFAGRNLQALDSLDRRIDSILAALAEFGDPLDGVRATSDRLRDSMAAQGFAMAIGDDVVIAGDGPDLAQMALIDTWFMTSGAEGTVMSDHLEDIFPGETLLLAKVRGMAAVKALSARFGWVRCYWFRPALPQEIAWAGNPNKPVIERAGVAALSPRRSFEKWIEVRSGYSRPWSNEEKLIVGKYRSGLLQWI